MLEYLPVKGEAKVGITKEIKEHKEITDHKNFPPFTNKIETIGLLRRKTFAVICDGKGNMNFQMLDSESVKLREESVKLREDMDAFHSISRII